MKRIFFILLFFVSKICLSQNIHITTWSVKDSSTRIANTQYVDRAVKNGVAEVTDSTVVSSSGSFILNVNVKQYVYSGITNVTWTLAAVAANTNKQYFLKNRGTGIVTVNAATGENFWTTASVHNITLNPGDHAVIDSDGTYWNTY